ncbi:hypothetical protein RRG08_064009 [Elysia crispata]|uniref:Uncharacterized protein n=1 Tax=Elysia crispata TaxID=231223 RepID=A0AAE0YFS4_9GAST|nr:hypothetical protein RRG08_064009 [Elysia crispata]
MCLKPEGSKSHVYLFAPRTAPSPFPQPGRTSKFAARETHPAPSRARFPGFPVSRNREKLFLPETLTSNPLGQKIPNNSCVDDDISIVRLVASGRLYYPVCQRCPDNYSSCTTELRAEKKKLH